MPELSVIILSYNTKEVTRKCLDLLFESLSSQKVKSEVIVVDNGSTDGSPEMLLEYAAQKAASETKLELILNKKNLGYPKGNNQGIEKSAGEFVLLLNSDAYVDHEIKWHELFGYMRKDEKIGVLTVKVVLENGKIDPASHRGFPTIWRSFTYFTGLEKIFGKIPLLSRVFGGYHLTHHNLNKVHEIDSPTGAFYLAKKDVLDRVKGFDDERFFLYGEDLDLSYRIKHYGYKLIYYPKYEVTHLKRTSGLERKDNEIQKKSKQYFYDAMKIFYKKHYENKYPGIINKLVFWAIDFKKKIS